MRKLIASMNMTLDGTCDHTNGIADDELHQYYTDLLNGASLLLYGRITYQLMEGYWPGLVAKPSGDKVMDEFAKAIDRVPKFVYSRTLDRLNWASAELKGELSKEAIWALKQGQGDPIYAGSPSLIAGLTRMGLIDEYQLCVHPMIVGSGLVLFKDMTERVDLKLLKTRTFGSGVLALTYERKA